MVTPNDDTRFDELMLDRTMTIQIALKDGQVAATRQLSGAPMLAVMHRWLSNLIGEKPAPDYPHARHLLDSTRCVTCGAGPKAVASC